MNTRRHLLSFLMISACISCNWQGQKVDLESLGAVSSLTSSLAVSGVEPFDDGALFFGDFTAECGADCFLQVWSQGSIAPFSLNDKLFEDARPVAVSNVLDGRIAVAVERGNAEDTSPQFKVYLVDLKNESILQEREVAFASEACFTRNGEIYRDCDSSEDVMRWKYNDYLQHLRMMKRVSVVLLPNGTIAMTLASSGSRNIVLLSQDLTQIGWALVLPTVLGERSGLFRPLLVSYDALGNRILVLEDGMTQAEFSILQKLNNVQARNKSSFREWETPLLFSVDPESGLVRSIDVIAVEEKQHLVVAGMAMVQDGVLVAGNLVGKNDKREGILFKLSNLEGEFRPVWSTKLNISEASYEVSAVIALDNGIIILAGEYGFLQLDSGSVIRPGDCFVATLNAGGEVRAVKQFGSDGNDRILDLKKTQDGALLVSRENSPITHDSVRTKERFEVRKITLN